MTNERGLTVDNIVSYQLVLPNGTVTTVDENVPDLFFALKVKPFEDHVFPNIDGFVVCRVATTTS